MWIQEFKDVEDVRRCLSEITGMRATMVEEYMSMCDVSFEDMEEDIVYIDELNGWLQHEMKSLEDGYEEYTGKN
jgi:hypothetical protein|tara:strand:- start:220 stop:441 length:222 start_codon:yes stop_codon:yes gene_type:complete